MLGLIPPIWEAWRQSSMRSLKIPEHPTGPPCYNTLQDYVVGHDTLREYTSSNLKDISRSLLL